MNKQKAAENGTVTKAQILGWINRTLKVNECRIETLGNGIVYCLLINHFHPSTIPKSRISMTVKNSFDNKANLKRVQDAIKTLGIKGMSFDIFRVSENSYMDNWDLINRFYRHFESENYLSEPLSATSMLSAQQSNPLQQKSQKQSSSAHWPNTQSVLQSKQDFTCAVSSRQQIFSGLLTPMKGSSSFEESVRSQCQSIKLMNDIKEVVKSEVSSDKVKVRELKKMLGLIYEHEESTPKRKRSGSRCAQIGFGEEEDNQLFSDCKKKREIITID